MRCSAGPRRPPRSDFSREIESGTMTYGKRTTSFSGRTGRMSGTERVSPDGTDDGSLALTVSPAGRGGSGCRGPSRSHASDDEDQEAVLEEGAGALGVGVLGKLEPALEGAGGPLEPEKPAQAAVGRETDAADGDDALLDLDRDRVGRSAGNLEDEAPALRVLHDVDRRGVKSASCGGGMESLPSTRNATGRLGRRGVIGSSLFSGPRGAARAGSSARPRNRPGPRTGDRPRRSGRRPPGRDPSDAP